MATAFGVRELGTALVVNSDSKDLLGEGRSGPGSNHRRRTGDDYQSGTKLPHSIGSAILITLLLIMPTLDDAQSALERHFGFSRFREGQDNVIEAVLAGQDVIVVMPTGGGKSLCYQLPALLFPGVTLVISPLIALMKDQVDALNARDIPATYINSSLSYDDQLARLRGMSRGEYRLVYIAPERFRNARFVESLKGCKIALFAVDEAHCISQWGHDFRPDYLRLREAADALGRPRIIALTATATPQVRSDIASQLGLKKASSHIAGFDRHNLTLRVEPCNSDNDRVTTAY